MPIILLDAEIAHKEEFEMVEEAIILEFGDDVGVFPKPKDAKIWAALEEQKPELYEKLVGKHICFTPSTKKLIQCDFCAFFNIGTAEENQEEYDFHMAMAHPDEEGT